MVVQHKRDSRFRVADKLFDLPDNNVEEYRYLALLTFPEPATD